MFSFFISVSTLNIFIKYKNDYIDFDKKLFLSKKAHYFEYEKDTLHFKNKFLCSNGTDVVKCVNEPAKWTIIMMGKKFKIFSQQSMFTEQKCWELINNKIKLSNCGNLDGQLFDIYDKNTGKKLNVNNLVGNDYKIINGNKDVKKSSTDFINNEKNFNGFDKGSNGNEVVDTNNYKGSKGIETPNVAIEGSNGNPTTDLVIKGSNGNETLDINKCTKNVDTINYGDLDPTKIYILNNCKNKIVRFKITTDNKEQICNDNNKEKNCSDNNKETFDSIDDKEQIDSNYFNNFKKKYTCNENNKMKRAAKYIEENYINFSDVFDFYEKIEKELSCK